VEKEEIKEVKRIKGEKRLKKEDQKLLENIECVFRQRLV
jgi:hypothetical protein